MTARTVPSFCRVREVFRGVLVNVKGNTVTKIRGDAQQPARSAAGHSQSGALGSFTHPWSYGVRNVYRKLRRLNFHVSPTLTYALS